jgi:hypothetical protein
MPRLQKGNAMSEKYRKKQNWENKAQYAQEQLDKNKALIEDTSRGTKSNKVNTWSLKPSVNRSRIQ